MKNIKLNVLLCSALFTVSAVTISCREGSNEQGAEAASEANADNSGSDTPAQEVGADQTPREASPGVYNDTITTTNHGNTTAKGSGQQ